MILSYETLFSNLNIYIFIYICNEKIYFFQYLNAYKNFKTFKEKNLMEIYSLNLLYFLLNINHFIDFI